MRQIITFDKFIRWALIALAVLAVGFIINALSEVLLPFFIAWLLAYLIYPIVKFVQYKLHVPGRALSIIIALIFIAAIFTAIFLFIIPPMFDQVDKFMTIVNKYLHETTHTNDIATTIQKWIKENQTEIERFLKSSDFTNTIKTAMPKLFSVIGQTASIVISIIASCILLDYEVLTNNWIKIFPKSVRPFWAGLAEDAERELNNYIRGQGLVSLCMGVLFCIGFTIIDFPMAIGMGILIGILNLVPYLHTFALIPTAFLALLKAADTGQNFWIIFASALIVFAVVQILSDMVITPKVMGKAMGLNPAILLLSLSVWGALLGFIGLIIALPLTTLIIAYWQRYVTKEGDGGQVENIPAIAEEKKEDKE